MALSFFQNSIAKLTKSEKQDLLLWIHQLLIHWHVSKWCTSTKNDLGNGVKAPPTCINPSQKSQFSKPNAFLDHVKFHGCHQTAIIIIKKPTFVQHIAAIVIPYDSIVLPLSGSPTHYFPIHSRRCRSLLTRTIDKKRFWPNSSRRFPAMTWKSTLSNFKKYSLTSSKKVKFANDLSLRSCQLLVVNEAEVLFCLGKLTAWLFTRNN